MSTSVVVGNRRAVRLYPLELAATTSVSGLGLLGLEIPCQYLVVGRGRHAVVWIDVVEREETSGNVKRQWGEISGARAIGLEMRIPWVADKAFLRCVTDP